MQPITDRDAIRGRTWQTGDRVYLDSDVWMGMWMIEVPSVATRDRLFGVVLQLRRRRTDAPTHMWSSMVEETAGAVWPRRGGA